MDTTTRSPASAASATVAARAPGPGLGARPARGPGARGEFGDETGEGLGAAGVAQDDVQAGGDSKAGQDAADGATADEAECLAHGALFSHGMRKRRTGHSHEP